MQVSLHKLLPIRLRRFGKRLLYVLLGLFWFSSLACGLIGWKLLHPARTPIKYVPENYGLPYDQAQFHSKEDAVLLKGWLIPDKKGDRDSIVIFAHGYLDNRSDNTAPLSIASVLRDCGIASLLFDFRGTGESEGAATSFGYREKDDLLGAVAYAKGLGYTNIGLLGFSMGASTAIMTAAEDPDVKVVVADSPYADFRELLEDGFARMSKLPKFPFALLLYYETALLGRLHDAGMNPLDAIRHLADRPVMLIHAMYDTWVPASNSQQLYSRADQDTTSLWMTGSHLHVGSYYAARNVYMSKVSEFFMESFHKTIVSR